MRKRNIINFADTAFWYIMYSLPFLAYILQVGKADGIISLTEFLSTFNGGINAVGNLIFSTMADIFGSNGILPLFNNTAVFEFVAWFGSVFLLHLAIDFVLWIPRFAHKVLKKVSED